MGGIISRAGRQTGPSQKQTGNESPTNSPKTKPPYRKREPSRRDMTVESQDGSDTNRRSKEISRESLEKAAESSRRSGEYSRDQSRTKQQADPDDLTAAEAAFGSVSSDGNRKGKPPAIVTGAGDQPERSASNPAPASSNGSHHKTTPLSQKSTESSPESAKAAAFTSSVVNFHTNRTWEFKSSRDTGDTESVFEEESAEVSLDALTSLDLSSDVRTIGFIQRWQRGNLIGSGSYGKVYLGMNLDSGELFVVKQVQFLHKPGQEQEEVIQLEQEIALLATLQHDNIVQYLGTERNSVTNELSIFLEHMPGGSVAELVERFGKLDESVIRKYTREVLEGLQYLHERGIIHRDIKGQNILVDNRGVCKLADFGASRHLQSADSDANLSFKGTPVFMSPEVIMEQRYSKKSDIWSVGCTVLQMATGNPPFSEFSNHIAALFHITNSTEPPPLPASLSENAKDFVLQCFVREAAKRPYAHALRKHIFLGRTKPKPTPGTNSGASSPLPVHATANKRLPNSPMTGPIQPPSEEEESAEVQYKKFRERRKKHVVKATIKRDKSRGPSLNSASQLGSLIRSYDKNLDTRSDEGDPGAEESWTSAQNSSLDKAKD